MTDRSSVLGAVLAGGKSTRMGTDKALLPINGRPMVQFAAETLSTVFSNVIVVGADEEKFGFLNLPIAPDIFEGCGPLGGIHAALTFAKPRSVFVLSCDIPFIPSRLVDYIVRFDSAEGTRIATFEGMLQPLCGLYNSASLTAIEHDLHAGKYSILKTLQNLGHAEIPITPDLPFYAPRMFLNVNRPEDYQTLAISEQGNRHG